MFKKIEINEADGDYCSNVEPVRNRRENIISFTIATHNNSELIEHLKFYYCSQTIISFILDGKHHKGGVNKMKNNKEDNYKVEIELY